MQHMVQKVVVPFICHHKQQYRQAVNNWVWEARSYTGSQASGIRHQVSGEPKTGWVENRGTDDWGRVGRRDGDGRSIG